MKRKLLGIISSFCLILVLVGLPLISACAEETVTPPTTTPPVVTPIPPTTTPTSTPTPTPTTTPTSTPTPTPGGPEGELIVVLPSLGNEIWGPGIGGGVDNEIKGVCNESLWRSPVEGQESKLQPELAESWTMSADGLTWDFYLREGIQFHEGWGEFTAEDAIYSFKLSSVPGSPYIELS